MCILASLRHPKVNHNVLRYLSTILLIICWGNLTAKTLVFSDNDDFRYINKETKIFPTDNDYQLNEILQLSGKFVTNPTGNKNYQYKKGGVWITWTLDNQSNESPYIQIRFSILDKVTLYKTDEKGKCIMTKVMQEWEYKNREIKHQFYNFDLNLKPNEKATYYLHVASKEQLVVPLKLGTKDQVYYSLIKYNSFFFIFFGAIILLFVYNTFIFISVKDPDYFWYLLYILVMTLTQLNRHGFLNMYIWPNNAFVPNFALSQFAALIGLSVLPFSMRFLGIEWKKSSGAYILYSIAIGLCVSLILGWMGHYTLSRQISIPMTLLGAVVLMILSIQRIMKVRDETLFFLIAWSVYMIFVVYFILSLSGIFPYNEFSEFTPEIGAVIEGGMLSFGLAKRINIANKEKLTSQEVALQNQKKYQFLLSEQNELLEQKVISRTEALNKANIELEGKVLSAQINPHFVFNVLNAIQVFILKSDKVDAYKYLAKFSKLMRFFLSCSLHTTISLEQEIDAIKTYLELEKVRFREKLNYVFEIDPQINTSHINIPSMLILPYLENAIWHGIAPLEENGELNIRLIKEGENIICSIEDNGKGINSERKAKKDHESVGMRITEKRMKLYAKSMNKKYQFTIHDKKEDLKQTQGTIVQFALPFEKAKRGI